MGLVWPRAHACISAARRSSRGPTVTQRSEVTASIGTTNNCAAAPVLPWLRPKRATAAPRASACGRNALREPILGATAGRTRVDLPCPRPRRTRGALPGSEGAPVLTRPCRRPSGPPDAHPCAASRHRQRSRANNPCRRTRLSGGPPRVPQPLPAGAAPPVRSTRGAAALQRPLAKWLERTPQAAAQRASVEYPLLRL